MSEKIVIGLPMAFDGGVFSKPKSLSSQKKHLELVLRVGTGK